MIDPLTPPDLDLRDFEWMPLEVVRLRDSGIVVVASAEAFRAAVLLWCAAWHQVPAASLPKDDRMLCSLAGFGRDLKSWKAVATDALHGFIECSDGRLYHPVIAKNAIESGSKKKKQGSQTAAATEAARLARLRRDAERDAERNGVRDGQRNGSADPERNALQGRGEERKGEDQNKKKSQTAAKAQPRSGDDFEKFKAAFPRRDGANPWLPAEKKFNALVKSGVDPEIMIRAATELAREEGSRGNVGTKFIPQAITWLNQQRFADYAAAAFLTEVPLKGYYAKAESEQLAAWDAWGLQTRGKGLPRDRNGGWRVDCEWPPATGERIAPSAEENAA